MCKPAASIAIFFLLVESSLPVYAQDAAPLQSPAVRVEASVTASSAYVWRGLTIGNRPVVQPGVSISAGGLSIASWGNVWHAAGMRTFSEHDLTVEYGRSIGPLAVSAGWTNYYFRDLAADSHSNELYARVGVERFLNPSVAVYHDFQIGSGTYVALGVEQALTAIGPFELSAAASLGYNDRNWAEVSGLSDVTASVRADWQLTPHLRVAPVVTGSRALKEAVGLSRVVWGIEAGLR